MAQRQSAAPQATFAWMKTDGHPEQVFNQWVFTVDAALAALLTQGLIGPLTNAANDGAAATAGVPINGLYRNGNAVQIRLI